MAVEAIFEKGVLKPVTTLHIPGHKRVHLIIEEEAEEPADILSLASEIYKDLSTADIEEVENQPSTKAVSPPCSG